MDREKNSLHLWLFLFGLVFAVFHIVPVFLKGFIRKPLTSGDLFDFLTPFAVMTLAIVLYFRLCQINAERFHFSGIQKTLSRILFGLGIILYIDGHGLHLSANSIARLLERANDPGLYDAVYLFDEIISHHMWDGGMYLISLSLIVASYKISYRLVSAKNIVLLFAGAIFYGFTFTVNSIEGQTVVFILPAALIGLLLSLGFYLNGLKSRMNNPLAIFFMTAYLLGLILFAYWGMRYGSFPQFSELGWI